MTSTATSPSNLSDIEKQIEELEKQKKQLSLQAKREKIKEIVLLENKKALNGLRGLSITTIILAAAVLAMLIADEYTTTLPMWFYPVVLLSGIAVIIMSSMIIYYLTLFTNAFFGISMLIFLSILIIMAVVQHYAQRDSKLYSNTRIAFVVLSFVYLIGLIGVSILIFRTAKNDLNIK